MIFPKPQRNFFAPRTCGTDLKLDSSTIVGIAKTVARDWVEPERVLVEAVTDSEGDGALRSTLVLKPDVAESMTGEQALDLPVAMQRSLRDQG